MTRRNTGTRMPNVVRLLRQIQGRPNHKTSLACGYGVHEFIEDQPYWGYRQCIRCEAVYALPKLLVRIGSASTPNANGHNGNTLLTVDDFASGRLADQAEPGPPHEACNRPS